MTRVLVTLGVVIAAGAWYRCGYRRARPIFWDWRIAHGWRLAAGTARINQDRLLDLLTSSVLALAGPFVRPCQPQTVRRVALLLALGALFAWGLR